MSVSFHSCDSYRNGYDTTENDENALTTVVTNVYDVVLLGFGQYGIVLLMKEEGSEKEWAVKITSADYHENEMHVACEVNRFPIFIKTYGWLQSNGIPNQWKQRLPSFDQDGNELSWHRLEEQRLLLLFMEFGRLRMDVPNASGHPSWAYKVHLTDHSKKAIFFMLLHGLMMARKAIGFSHNDIRDGQIILVARNPTQPIKLGKYCIRGATHVPKLIDFGTAVTNSSPTPMEKDERAHLWSNAKGTKKPQPIQDSMQSDDVFRLGVLFGYKSGERFEEAALSDRTNWKVIQRLLGAKYFAEFRSNDCVDEEICHNCWESAAYIIPSQNWTVCEKERCLKKLHY